VTTHPYQFQHTARELRECYDALRFKGAASLDQEENEAMRELVEMCCNILDVVGVRVEPSDVREALAQMR
jgi:hypothetical protein